MTSKNNCVFLSVAEFCIFLGLTAQIFPASHRETGKRQMKLTPGQKCRPVSPTLSCHCRSKVSPEQGAPGPPGKAGMSCPCPSPRESPSQPGAPVLIAKLTLHFLQRIKASSKEGVSCVSVQAPFTKPAFPFLMQRQGLGWRFCNANVNSQLLIPVA